jgi:hypothetical protein
LLSGSACFWLSIEKLKRVVDELVSPIAFEELKCAVEESVKPDAVEDSIRSDAVAEWTAKVGLLGIPIISSFN